MSKINLFLFLGVVLLILGFKNSENLSHAYGISVTGAMLVDTILATFLLITVRKWNKLIFIPVFLVLLIIDFVFLSSNLEVFDEEDLIKDISKACTSAGDVEGKLTLKEFLGIGGRNGQ